MNNTNKNNENNKNNKKHIGGLLFDNPLFIIIGLVILIGVIYGFYIMFFEKNDNFSVSQVYDHYVKNN